MRVFGRHKYHRTGFTLVEVLIVVGIMTILLAILLPATAWVREAARKAACASNERQLVAAFRLYAQSNNDRFPRPAAGNLHAAEDWIYWQDNYNQNQGRLVPYTNGAKFTADLYRCPSDDVTTHVPLDGQTYSYKYSYTVNEIICVDTSDAGKTYKGVNGTEHYPGQTMTVNEIRSPSTKILLVEESEQTINDGAWAPQKYTIGGSGMQWNIPTNRHDAYKTYESSQTLATTGYDNARANCAYVDGHVEFVPRNESMLPAAWDPLVP